MRKRLLTLTLALVALIFVTTDALAFGLPRLTTDTSNPVLYYIRNTRGVSVGKANYWTSSNAMSTSESDAVQVYFTGSTSNGTATVKIIDNATGKQLTKSMTWADEGVDWYIQERTSDQGGKDAGGNLAYKGVVISSGLNSDGTVVSCTTTSSFNGELNGCWYVSSSYDKVKCYTPTFDGSIFTLEPLNVFPEITTDTDKPIYYRLYHMYTGKYFKASESGHALVSSAAEASLYYFTANTGKETDGRIYVHTWSPDVPGKIAHSATVWKAPSSITRHWYFKKQTNSCYTGFITAHDDNSDPWSASSSSTVIGYAGSNGVDYKGNIFNVEYVPSDLIELGDYELSIKEGNVTAKQIESGITFSYPHPVNTSDEAITLKTNHGILVNGEAATVSFANGILTIKNLPTSGTFTISIPAGAIGYQTSGVTNEAISLTYNIVEPLISEAKQGYLRTTVNDAPRFMTRGSSWCTRAVLGDYGIPVEVAATDGDNATTITFLDKTGKLYSDGNAGGLYTDGAEKEISFIVEKVADGKYKLKANNSKYTGYIGMKDVFKLYQDKSEADALVWEFMGQDEYQAYVAQHKADLKEAALQAANITADDYANAIILATKSNKDTETSEIAEHCMGWSDWEKFRKTWEYTVDPGLYRIKLNAFMRCSVSANFASMVQNGFDAHMAFLSVNGDSILIHSIWDGRQTAQIASGASYEVAVDGTKYYVPVNQTAAGYMFDNTKLYENEMLVNVGNDGKLKIDLYTDAKADATWLSYRDLTIEQVITSLDDYKKIANDEIASYTELGEDIRTNAQNEVNGAESIEDVITILNGVRDAENARQNGITDWSNTTLTRNIENEGVQQLLNADYSWLGAKPVLSETPAQADQPRPITIPVQRYDGNATVSITETENDYTNCFTTTASAAAGNIDCQYNAIPGHTYYYKVEDAEGNLKSKGQVSVEGMLRMIYAEGGSNMRDLGGRITVDGKRVKYGRLFRGGELHAGYQTTLTAAGIAEMQRLGIKAELDLRQDNEVNGNTASAIPGAEYLYVNLVPSGTEIIYDEPGIYQEKIKNGIHFIAENLKKGNVYYHCIWGADRTGAMSMFLECILGCQLSDIEKDYQLTSYSKAGLRPNSSFNLDGKLIAIEDLGYEGNTIQEKVVSFLKSIGVTEADITTIREQLLEENTDAMASYMSTLNTAYGKVATAAGTTFAEATTAAAAQSNINSAMAALTEVKDITSLLHNPEFEENGGTLDNWATRGDGCGKGGSTNHVGRIFDTTGSIRQTLQNMPAGTYTVKVQAFNRKGSGANESTKGEGYQKYANGEQKATSYLKLNGSQTILRNIYEDAISTEYSSGGYNPVLGINVPENTTGSALAMSSSTDGGRLYWNVATVTLDKAGDLTIGIVAPENIAGDYTVMDNFKLYYEPAGVETPTINLDQTAATTLPAIDGAYKVTSNRTLATGKWNTLCLPFDLSAEEIATTPITEVRQMSTCEITGNDAQVAFAEVSEIKAGKPYIVKVSEDWTVASDKAIVRAKTPVQSTIAEGISILGNYNPTTLNGQYYISGNKFYYADEDVPMKGYRASITLPEGTSVKAFGIDDTTDALETIEGEENADKTLYDLSGRRIAQPNYRGIYIRGGKKVVVK